MSQTYLRRSPLRRVTCCAFGVLLALLAACSTEVVDSGSSASTAIAGTPKRADALQIVTTVAPITSIVANVAGPGVTITGLIPEGTNSHTFEPPPSAAAALSSADVIFINGLGLEDPTEVLAKANLAAGARIVKLGDEVLPESEWIFDFAFPVEGGKPNPHLWTNPPMVREYAAVIRDTLSEADPASATTYQKNFETFASRIEALDAAMIDATESIEPANRTLLTYHDAYAYFADNYGWTVVGAIQPADFAEPSARDVAELITQIRVRDVAVVFGSEVFPSPVLEQIATETGADYIDDLRDDDLPGEPGDPEHSWLSLMRLNYVTMVRAFGGDVSALDAVDTSDVTPDRAEYPK